MTTEAKYRERIEDLINRCPMGREDLLREAEGLGLTRDEAAKIVDSYVLKGAVRFE